MLSTQRSQTWPLPSNYPFLDGNSFLPAQPGSRASPVMLYMHRPLFLFDRVHDAESRSSISRWLRQNTPGHTTIVPSPRRQSSVHSTSYVDQPASQIAQPTRQGGESSQPTDTEPVHRTLSSEEREAESVGLLNSAGAVFVNPSGVRGGIRPVVNAVATPYTLRSWNNDGSRTPTSIAAALNNIIPVEFYGSPGQITSGASTPIPDHVQGLMSRGTRRHKHQNLSRQVTKMQQVFDSLSGESSQAGPSVTRKRPNPPDNDSDTTEAEGHHCPGCTCFKRRRMDDSDDNSDGAGMKGKGPERH